MPTTARHLLILLGVSTAVFFCQLGATRLWDIDEAIFAQSAWEMYSRGDLVTPYFNGEIFAHKPALTYWCMIAAYELFGPTEFAARFWSAIFGLASVAVTYRLGQKLFSPIVGLWAGLILATNLNFDVIARAATPDSPLIFFTSLAVLAFVEVAHFGDGVVDARAIPARKWMLVYAAMGLAVLVKGPVGVVLPTAVIGLFLLLAAETKTFLAKFNPVRIVKTIWAMRPFTALAAVLVVAGPWYLGVGLKTDGRWLSEFFGVHNFGRFLHPMESHRGPIFYYLIAILVGLFPWSTFTIPTVIHLRRRLREAGGDRRGYLLAIAWIVVWVGFFSIASTKLPSYVVPAYPALALLLAAFVCSWEREPASVRPLWPRLAFGITAAVGLTVIIVMPFVAVRYLTSDPWLGLFGLAPLIGGITAIVLYERTGPRRALATMCVSAALLSVGLFGWAAVRVDQFQNSELLAGVIRRQTTGLQPTIAQSGYFRPSLVFYTKRPVAQLDSEGAVNDFFRAHDRDAFLVTTSERYEEISRELPQDVTILERQRAFLKKGDVILLGRQPNLADRSAPDSRSR